MKAGFLIPNYWGMRYMPGLYWPEYGVVTVVYQENLYFSTPLTLSENFSTELVKTRNFKTTLTKSKGFDTPL